MKVPVGISNRHIHLSDREVAILFGDDHELTPFKPLSQPAQYAAEETVTIKGPKGFIEKVRVLGPTRRQTQIEISRTDCFTLGINPPVRDSGDVEGSAGLEIIGPNGSVHIDEGVIIAQRHIHMHTKDAENYGLEDKDRVFVKTGGDRSIIFENVLIRVSDKFSLEFHVDTDEGNAASLKNGQLVEIISVHILR
ncbi:propanediol utilization protein [Desulfuribacillus stibiiarsenatis]|uniref:Phosphate propanoyltransferase n=1 Tax=Desulfuribacillus stibiiarsenatis TaxID=1390249 RepID=A0A1E5L3W5_9FIRM|nr:phosphate propanoyltransferase [Desulfuribacillus stibiiarsenatis]OEH84784.1 propanediol utilization protein [Desulfuribacillus stibiiarsenatis]